MRTLEIMELYLDNIIKSKTIKILKKQLKTNFVATEDLIPGNNLTLELKKIKIKEEYEKIFNTEKTKMVKKLTKKIKEIIK